MTSTLLLSPGSLPLRTKLVTTAVCVGIAIASIVTAARYTRAAPAPAAGPPGLHFGSDSVALSPTAPAWSALAVERPLHVTSRWSAPIPARIAFDESRASRVGAPLGGRITAVFVEPGQTVHVGQPLFQIASSNLAELHGEIAKAEIETRGAKIDLDRTQALVDAGSLPGKELVAAKQALAEAELAGRLARQKLGALEVTSSSDSAFTVVAPREGVVVEKHVAVGQQVDVSTGDLMAVADLSSVWVLADLFETEAATVHVGQAARVTVDSSSIQRDAVVEQVSAVVDPDRHTVPIRIRLANPDGSLRPNAHAAVQLMTDTSGGLVVPATAVLSDGAHSYLYVAEPGGTMRRREVVTAMAATDGKVTVLSGITRDDRVVVKGGILLDNAIQLHDE